MMNGQTILITEGSSYIGRKFAKNILLRHQPSKLIIFSNDELAQYEMQQEFDSSRYPCLRYFIGDINDRDRLYRAFNGVDLAIHLESLHLPFVAEYNPFEAVKRNIIGAINVIDAAIDRNVKQVVSISTVSSVNSGTLIGLMKSTSEKLFVAGNSYSGENKTRFCVVRISSVLGHDRNIVSEFLRMRESGIISIADAQRTRFWMTPEDAVEFIITCLDRMVKGEIFIPKLPSVRDVDLARAIGPKCEIRIAGNSPGETLHETLLSENDAQFALEYPDYYSIIPFYLEMGRIIYFGPTKGVPCHTGFHYRSDNNLKWLSVSDLQEILKLT